MFLILMVINTIFTTIATNLTIWLVNLPLSVRDHTMLLVSMCHTMPFSARTLKKKHFFGIYFCCKKKIEMHVINNECVPKLFSQTLFLYCFCMLSRFPGETWKSDTYKYLNCIVQPLHFQVQIFKCQQTMTGISFWITWLHLASPQHFDHEDDAYLLSIRVQTTLNNNWHTPEQRKMPLG